MQFRALQSRGAFDHGRTCVISLRAAACRIHTDDVFLRWRRRKPDSQTLIVTGLSWLARRLQRLLDGCQVKNTLAGGEKTRDRIFRVFLDRQSAYSWIANPRSCARFSLRQAI